MTLPALVASMRLIATEPVPDRDQRIRDLAPVILREARRHRLDPVLVASVAWHESRWSMDARGAAGELGVMQIHPRGQATFLCRRLPILTLPGNVACGCAILARARDRCGGRPERWVGAFAGHKCGETRYGRRVMRRAK